MRAATHDRYDRLVIQFDRTVPAYDMMPNRDGPGSTNFVGSFSGLPIKLAGSYGVQLRLDNIDMPNTYPQGNDLKPRFATLKEVRVIGDFEGVTDFALGLSGNVCPTVFELSNPPRLVMDFPNGG